MKEVSEYNNTSDLEFYGYPGIGYYKQDFTKILDSFLIKGSGTIILAFGHVDIRKLFNTVPDIKLNEVKKVVDQYVDYCDNTLKNFDVYYIDPFPQIGYNRKFLDEMFSTALKEKAGDRRIISQSDILLAIDRTSGITNEDFIIDKSRSGTMLQLDLAEKYFNLIYQKLLTLPKRK